MTAQLLAGGRRAAVALVALVLATAAQAGPTAYTIGGLYQPGGASALQANVLCTIDLATGELTPIGQVDDPNDPFTFTPSFEALEFDPTTGILYAVTGQENLVSIDPATAVATRIGNLEEAGIPLNSAGYGLGARSTGEMFVSAGESGPFFGRIDLATGEVDRLLVGVTGVASAGWTQAVAVDGDDEVFTTDRNAVPEPVLQHMPVTPGGAAGPRAPIGSMGSGINLSVGLDFDDQGVLWGIEAGGVSSSTANSTLFTVDPSTGVRTFVATPTDPTTGLQIRAECLAVAPAAVGPVPLLGPAAGVALLAALAALGVRRARSAG